MEIGNAKRHVQWQIGTVADSIVAKCPGLTRTVLVL